MRFVSVLFAVAVLAASPAVLAHGAPRPLGGTVDGLPAGPVKRDLAELLERARRESVEPRLYEAAVHEAVRAMERARNARAAGDVLHAGHLEQVAEEWVRAASCYVRARLAERATEVVARRSKELGSAVVRARTLLEENQGHRGRLEAEVNAAAARPKPPVEPDSAAAKRPPKASNLGPKKAEKTP